MLQRTGWQNQRKWWKWALARQDEPELLDLGAGSPADVQHNLLEMGRINHTFGGVRALTRHLYPRLAAAGDGVQVVDLGTGSADIPAIIARWARARRQHVSIAALDWSPRNLAVAQIHTGHLPTVRLLCADATRLPLARQGADYLISSLFLHHFSPDQVVALLRTAYDCSRRGLIMSDLVRGWLPLAAFKLIQPIFARNFLTRHDGALSVRRAYTPDELRALASAAGLAGARVYTHWPWRMTLVVDR